MLQGVKLFYRVLESMLKAEQDRTGRSNFGSLLSSASFHKCLAACCFEVVIASYRMVSPVALFVKHLPGRDVMIGNPARIPHHHNQTLFSLYFSTKHALLMAATPAPWEACALWLLVPMTVSSVLAGDACIPCCAGEAGAACI